MSQTHQQVTASQFGPRAQAYVASTAHSAGADLDWLQQRLEHSSVDSLLDVGCGGGHVSYRLAKYAGQVTACDPSEEMIAVVGATAAQRGITNINVVRAAAESLPFADASFDVAVTRFSAHHWEHLDKGLSEISRVLKPGHRFFMMDVLTPANPLLDTHLQTIELLRDPSHVRDYSVAEWTATLGRTHFAIDEVLTARMHIDFALWCERMQTHAIATDAIRHLMNNAPSEVKQHFGFDDEGNFWLDTIWIRAHRA